jgi:RNA polymerase sigma-70 factor (ECF subfamily)
MRQTDVNGEPGIVAVDRDGRLVRVIAVEIAAGQIRAVNSVANPDKLRHLGPLADLGAEEGSR